MIVKIRFLSWNFIGLKLVHYFWPTMDQKMTKAAFFQIRAISYDFGLVLFNDIFKMTTCLYLQFYGISIVHCSGSCTDYGHPMKA